MRRGMEEMRTAHRTTTFVFILLATMLMFIGCGDSVLESLSDDDSFEAQLEEARIALDDGDYEKAVTCLEHLNDEYPGDQAVKQYLSNAYAGLGGMDTYDFLSTIDALDDSGLSGSVDMVGKVIGDPEGRLTEAELLEKLVFLEQAIELMDELVGGGGSATIESVQIPDKDLVVQRGLLGLSRTVLLMAELIVGQLGIEEVVMTEEGIRVMYRNEVPDFEGLFNESIEEDMANDMVGIANAITAIRDNFGTDNDLYEDFEQFMNDLDTDGNRRINRMELESYLQRIIQA